MKDVTDSYKTMDDPESRSDRLSSSRRYPEVAAELRQMIGDKGLPVDSKLPAERILSESLEVSRSLLREALIMLEVQGIVEVRQGSGVYILKLPETGQMAEPDNDFGPFELLQARQILESSIAEVAACMVNKSDIAEMQQLLRKEKASFDNEALCHEHDKQFHYCVARASQNTLLLESVVTLWEHREKSPMWQQLLRRIANHDYRSKWFDDHNVILAALKRKDPIAARHAMWQHLENVRNTLFELSDVDAPEFDGFLFQSLPIGVPRPDQEVRHD